LSTTLVDMRPVRRPAALARNTSSNGVLASCKRAGGQG
jgi:hypothetical protein